METRHRCRALAGGLAICALAVAEPQQELELSSCVAGSPPLRVAASDVRATLDSPDRRHFHDAAAAHFPLYQRGGLAPAEVLMLQRGVQWQYVVLMPAGAKGRCFTAVFAASRFEFTERWIAKYRPTAVGVDG